MAKDSGKKSNNLMLVIIILLLVIVIAGAAIGIFVFKGMNSEKKIVEEVLMLDEIIVNLDDPSMKKYVKFGLAITYDSKNKNILGNINSNMYKIKDGIISVFKEKKVSDIEANQGIGELKQEIKNKIDEILDGNQILSVYFTNLLIH